MTVGDQIESVTRFATLIRQRDNLGGQEGQPCKCGFQRFAKRIGYVDLVVILVELEAEDGGVSKP